MRGIRLLCVALLASPLLVGAMAPRAEGAPARPQISIRGTTVTEGNSRVPARFRVALSRPAERWVRVRFATVAVSASGGRDFIARHGTLRFRPGARRRTIAIPVVGDRSDEDTETFRVRLSHPRRAGLARRSAVAEILDDDPPPTVSIGDAGAAEGTGTTPTLKLPVTLSVPSGKPVSVDFATAPGSAEAPADYVAAGGAVSFAPGQSSGEAAVTLEGDSLDEPDETIVVTLSNPVNASLGNVVATGTILDDDPPPSLSIADTSVNEGTSGTVTATFDVTLSAISAKPVSASFATADGSAHAPADYTAKSGSVDFAPGETAKHVTVTVASDYDDEPDEAFTVNLSDPVNATLGHGSGTATILDDDPPCIAADPPSAFTSIGAVAGDEGIGVLTRNDSISPCGDVDWFRFSLAEVSDEMRDLTATITLTTTANDSPQGGDIDLCVFQESNTSITSCSTHTAGVTEQICVRKAEVFGTDDSRALLVEVYGFGNAVNSYQLKVTGNTGAGPSGCLILS